MVSVWNKIVGVVSLMMLLACPMPTMAASTTSSAPVLNPDSAAYVPTANEFASAIIVDAASGKVLYSFKPDMAWPAASLTKLMGALVAIDQKPNWNKIVSLKAADEVGGGRLRVKTGAKMSVRDLLYSSVLASANNAAMALARVTGLSKATFIKKMNAKAKALGMTSTTFVDPSGIDPGNVTTVRDLTKLASTAFANPLIRGPASSYHYAFTIRNTGEHKTLTNTNKLLTQDPEIYVYGGKTGFLYESMYNVAVQLQPNPRVPEKPKLLVVVFGAQTESASFAAAKSLATWAWGAYEWK
jgi:serine-type D-Ala-D-Ala endopeptidase (penicillin-binding protein 7)